MRMFYLIQLLRHSHSLGYLEFSILFGPYSVLLFATPYNIKSIQYFHLVQLKCTNLMTANVYTDVLFLILPSPLLYSPPLPSPLLSPPSLSSLHSLIVPLRFFFSSIYIYFFFFYCVPIQYLRNHA